MNASVGRQLDREKRKINARLAPLMGGKEPKKPGSPEFNGPHAKYEIAGRVRAVTCGGLAAMRDLVRRLGLPAAIDGQLGVLKRARPYRDSDHILNIAYNVLCGGHVLDDIEVRRNDAAFLDMLCAEAIPDPTTAGDFCRRFDGEAVWRLMRVVNETRVGVWRRSRRAVATETARIDADGSIVPTLGECKQGMDLSYKGIWGYHPLLISLANTGRAKSSSYMSLTWLLAQASDQQVLASEPHDEAFFWGTHQGAEIDLLLRRGDALFGVEVKRADSLRLTPSIRTAHGDLGLVRVAVVHPGQQRYPLGDRVEAVPLTDLARPRGVFGHT